MIALLLLGSCTDGPTSLPFDVVPPESLTDADRAAAFTERVAIVSTTGSVGPDGLGTARIAFVGSSWLAGDPGARVRAIWQEGEVLLVEVRSPGGAEDAAAVLVALDVRGVAVDQLRSAQRLPELPDISELPTSESPSTSIRRGSGHGSPRPSANSSPIPSSTDGNRPEVGWPGRTAPSTGWHGRVGKRRVGQASRTE